MRVGVAVVIRDVLFYSRIRPCPELFVWQTDPGWGVPYSIFESVSSKHIFGMRLIFYVWLRGHCLVWFADIALFGLNSECARSRGGRDRLRQVKVTGPGVCAAAPLSPLTPESSPFTHTHPALESWWVRQFRRAVRKRASVVQHC